MSTATNKNAVLIPEASSDIGLGVAARGSAVSTVATEPTFGSGKPAIAPLSLVDVEQLGRLLGRERFQHAGR